MVCPMGWLSADMADRNRNGHGLPFTYVQGGLHCADDPTDEQA